MTFESKKIWSFRDLKVYQKAYEASLKIHAATLNFPKIEQFGGMADQIRRSSKSICANLAEGFAKKRTPGEFRRYMSIAIGSSDEMQVWLDYCRDLKYIEPTDQEFFAQEYSNISKMLVGLRASWKDKT
jgi:four helix bundle protein